MASLVRWLVVSASGRTRNLSPTLVARAPKIKANQFAWRLDIEIPDALLRRVYNAKLTVPPEVADITATVRYELRDPRGRFVSTKQEAP